MMSWPFFWRRRAICPAAAIAFMLMVSADRGGGAEVIVLESFEEGIGVATGWNSGRATLGSYEVGVDDPGLDVGQATHGTTALAADIAGAGGWGQDFQVELSPEATQILLAAWNSGEPNRYQLRIDLTLPPLSGNMGTWMNVPIENGGMLAQLDNNNSGGPQTFVIALDEVGRGLAVVTNAQAEQVARIGFVTNGDWTASPRIYVDNIRLLDTYAPDAAPLVTVLDSFEDGVGGLQIGPGWGARPAAGATAVEAYQSTGAGDANVTDGEFAARVAMTAPGWSPDVFFSLTQYPELAEILALPAAERQRYQLQWDFRYATASDIGWGLQHITLEFPVTLQVGQGTSHTYTLPLDQLTQNTVTLVTNGGWSSGQVDVFIDNFRLVDTGYVPPPSLIITDVTRDAFLQQASVTWQSKIGAFYAVDISDDLMIWLELTDSYASGGDSTSYTYPLTGEEETVIFRVREISAP